MKTTGGFTGMGHGLSESLTVRDAAPAMEGVQQEGLSRIEMAGELAEALENIDGLKIENWEKMTLDERVDTLQQVENTAASLGGRAPLRVVAVDMGGYNAAGIITNGEMRWHTGQIAINECHLKNGTMASLRPCTQTLVHEGRHAYQFSNLYVRRTEPDTALYASWKHNLDTGYKTSGLYGFEIYARQPIEADASAFASEACARVTHR